MAPNPCGTLQEQLVPLSNTYPCTSHLDLGAICGSSSAIFVNRWLDGEKSPWTAILAIIRLRRTPTSTFESLNLPRDWI